MLQTQIPAAFSPAHWSELLEEVYQGRQTYECKGGFNIPLHSHDVWMVCRGIVQLGTVHSDGNEAILGIAYPEMPFGLPLTQIDPYIATSLSDVVLMRLSQREIEQSPALAQGINFQLNRRLQQTEALLNLVHQRHLRARLQQLLLLLATEVGKQTPDGIRIGVRLTHRQLANLVGTTRVTMTNTIGLLRKEGWLSVDKTRHFVIHDSVGYDL